MGEGALISVCALAALVHAIVHCAIIKWLIPLVVPDTTTASLQTFEECQSRQACSWFTSNPIHCLRSKDFYGHEPPCSYFLRGREHFMVDNPKIGQYFSVANLYKKLDE